MMTASGLPLRRALPSFPSWLALLTLLTLLVGLVPLDPPQVPSNTLDLWRQTQPSMPSITTSLAPTGSSLLSHPELIERREEFARHYDLGNGRYLAIASPTPLNYRDRFGNWQPIRPAFVQVPGGWQVRENSLRSILPERGTTLMLEHEGVQFAWQPRALVAAGADRTLATPLAATQATPAVPSNNGLTVSYERAWSDSGLTERFHSAPGAVKQELVLHQAPAAVSGAEWLEFQVALELPAVVQIYADGIRQEGTFSTSGPLELRAPDGAHLLTIAAPIAYEQANPAAGVAGRYLVSRDAGRVTLAIQTPWSWWVDPARQYPAVLDPTMQVTKDLQNAKIDVSRVYEGEDPVGGNSALSVGQNQTCVGHFEKAVNEDQDRLGLTRGYVRFPLPTLPDGVTQPSSAFVVAVPDASAGSDPSYQHYSDRIARQPTYLLPMSENWTDDLLAPGVTTVPSYPAGQAADSGSMLALLRKPQPNQQVAALPATLWDVSTTAIGWYANPAGNYGFALKPFYNVYHRFGSAFGAILPDPGQTAPSGLFTYPTFMCFPAAATWSNLDTVAANLSTPGQATTDGAGLGMLVLYEAQSVAEEFRQVRVPSAVPIDSYRHQFHEYRVPVVANQWHAIAAQGMNPDGDGVNVNTPVDLVDGLGNPLTPAVSSDMGAAAPVNAGYDYQPNYVLVNGNQGPLRVRVQADNKPTTEFHGEKLYGLQYNRAIPSPQLGAPGVQASIPIVFFRELIQLQELNLPENTTVEISVPYNEIAVTPAITKATAGIFELQVFPPNLAHASRQQGGALVTPGPEGYEIEFSVGPGMGGRWLLVANTNRTRATATLQARVTVCENTSTIARYPVGGQCVELRRPPANLDADPAFYRELGMGATRLRLFSAGGFDCVGAVCTTRPQDASGTAVMPLIGYGDDNQRWVTLKSGTVTLDGGAGTLTTSSGARLLLADFSDPNTVASLPVLRGMFQATLNNGGRLVAISQPADTDLLVNSPLHAQDNVGWTHEINMESDRLVGNGSFQRVIQPNAGQPSTTVNLAGQWSISAAGGPSLQNRVTYQTIMPSATFSVGSLLVTAPTSGYSIEHIAAHANPSLPASVPLFRQIRVINATLAQTAEMGSAQLPVQALFLNPGASVKDENGDNPSVQCGASCFDLRGPDDRMNPGGPQIDREYRMPDLIIQDTANSMMVQSAGHLEVMSTDHPMYQPQNADDISFSYEAYEGSVRTYSGECPQARDPLNPGNHVGQAGQITTVMVGTASMSMPNLRSEAGADSGAPQIAIEFVLCAGSLREIGFTFDTGADFAIPIGSSGLFMNLIGGTVSLTPKQPGQNGYTTVVLEVGFRGMTMQLDTSNLRMLGRVTIDSRGLFDVQVQVGIRILGADAVGADGHFWVAWSPLDLGFVIQACVPTETTNPAEFPYPGTLCAGNELLFGEIKAHMWQGQGWQNRYPYLPDNDDLHVTARFTAKITIPAGAIVDWGPVVVPPGDLTLGGLKLAFGEFCMNNACTSYEWGVMGAFTVLGYDVGMYYGFDSGISFIAGSADYLLIDEAGAQAGAGMPEQARIAPQAVSQRTITIQPGTPSALFVIGGDNASVKMALQEPGQGGRLITAATNASDVMIDNRLRPGGSYQSLITVKNPKPGTWALTIDTGTAQTYRFFYASNKPAPSLVVNPLPNQVTNAASIPVSWTSSVPAGANARVSLYYEKVEFAGVKVVRSAGPIVERLPLTPNGTYNWDIRGMATGYYKIYARIDNNAAAVINACADQTYNPNPKQQGPCGTMLNPSLMLPVERIDVDGQVQIVDTIAPAAPQGVKARSEGISSVSVVWKPSIKANGEAERDLGGYVVTCTQGQLQRSVRIPATLGSGAALLETARVNGLNQAAASCSVQTYDFSGNLSGPSAGATATPGAVVAPPAQVQALQAVTQPSFGKLLVQWQAEARATGYLLYYRQLPAVQHNLAAATPMLPAVQRGAIADQGRSPLNIGNLTSAELSGLTPGATYELWVRPYDDDGRIGERSSVVQVTLGPGGHLIHLPVVTR